ncbi:hypothetical protein PIB30_073746, partial [Stylosanthes scabra]|nr:hypothetical protein [Stylosanthes scabra]
MASFLVLTFAMSTTFYTCTKVIPVFLQKLYILMREAAYNAYRRSSYVLTYSIISLLPPALPLSLAPPRLLLLITPPLSPTPLPAPLLSPRRDDSGVVNLCLRVVVSDLYPPSSFLFRLHLPLRVAVA